MKSIHRRLKFPLSPTSLLNPITCENAENCGIVEILNLKDAVDISLLCLLYTDIDECKDGLHSCTANTLCVDTNGTFRCECFPGFQGNGRICLSMCLLESHVLLTNDPSPCMSQTSSLSQNSLVQTLSYLNQAEHNHLADKWQTC